jgi:hypothetical protein
MVEDRQCQTGENRDPTETRLGVPFTRIPPVEPCQHHTESCNMSEDGFCDQAQPGIPWWYPMVPPRPLPHETRVVSQP